MCLEVGLKPKKASQFLRSTIVSLMNRMGPILDAVGMEACQSLSGESLSKRVYGSYDSSIERIDYQGWILIHATLKAGLITKVGF